MVRTVTAVLVVFSVIGLALPAARAMDDSTAKGVVERLQTDVIEVLKQAEQLGVRGRYEKLLPILQRDAHLVLMTATSTGVAWRDATKTQQQRAVKAFAEMHTALLAGLFDSYGGETFRTRRVRKTDGKVVLVDSEIFDKDGDPTSVTFVTAKIHGRWWVIDIVIAGGISEVQVKKDEYHRLLADGGIDHLSDVLEKKKRRLLSGEEKPVR